MYPYPLPDDHSSPSNRKPADPKGFGAYDHSTSQRERRAKKYHALWQHPANFIAKQRPPPRLIGKSKASKGAVFTMFVRTSMYCSQPQDTTKFISFQVNTKTKKSVRCDARDTCRKRCTHKATTTSSQDISLSKVGFFFDNAVALDRWLPFDYDYLVPIPTPLQRKR